MFFAKVCRVCLPVLLAILFLVSCGQKPQEKIRGAWQDNEQGVIEFFQDGTFTMKSKKAELGGLKTLTGRWLILDDGRLKLDISMLGVTQTLVYKVRFDGGEMILTDETGETRHKKLTAAPEFSPVVKPTTAQKIPGGAEKQYGVADMKTLSPREKQVFFKECTGKTRALEMETYCCSDPNYVGNYKCLTTLVVKVLANGTVLVDEKQVTLAELKIALTTLKQHQGILRYRRQSAAPEAGPAVEIITKAFTDGGLHMDFSD